mmetsp:Transcript_70977/g.203430  ORF Transcript_70977/g.203430 Transcript_70977/m.203430 type:complete len:216 (+) Transcript_70977:26-673(+)
MCVGPHGPQACRKRPAGPPHAATFFHATASTAASPPAASTSFLRFCPLGSFGGAGLWLRGSLLPSGHLGRISTACSVPASEGGSSYSPNFKRSTPAQATITPLSTQSLGGGHLISKSQSSATSRRPCRTAWFAATPPATTIEAVSGSISTAHSAARPARSQRCRTATFWKAAAMCARACRRSGSDSSFTLAAGISLSMSARTAVLRPENEKSQPF